MIEPITKLNYSVNSEHSLVGLSTPGCKFIRSVDFLGKLIALTSANEQ